MDDPHPTQATAVDIRNHPSTRGADPVFVGIAATLSCQGRLAK